MQIYYFDESLYLVISAGYKIGILLFLLRIFPAKGFRTITYGVIGFNVAWGIASVFMTIFQCIPIRKAWDWEHIVPGRCNNIHVQAWTAAAMGIFLDLVILVLPIPELLKLQLNTKKKLGLLAMFSVGIFITIASIIRLQTLVHFSNSHDPTWDNIPATYWTAIEMNVGVSCACMPALRPLLKGAFPKLGTLFSSSKGATGNTSNSSGTIERIKQRQGALRMEEGSAGHSYRSDGTIDTKSDTTVVELSHMDTRTGAQSDMHDVSWDADSSRGIVDRKDNVF
ncbi:putative cfem domain-containing protein [Neofusicoccum parvum]|uniref:Cfem domain-containing protein n=1 Tax=Neofusicoccum parvum TaxID=310453 RepID=A0ACB5RMU3_9PEZI|nr:putative cfem domain-containing protein [Neofusicoccum parvum]GME33372.1 putative cfem domain-containing protein [Neofusicoccum parvum]